MKRSSHIDDFLTDDEQGHIERTASCPDCNGRLLQGPSGGESINLKCGKCGSMYNFCPGFFSERISDSSRLAIGGLSTPPPAPERGLLSKICDVRGWISKVIS